MKQRLERLSIGITFTIALVLCYASYAKVEEWNFVGLLGTIVAGVIFALAGAWQLEQYEKKYL